MLKCCYFIFFLILFGGPFYLAQNKKVDTFKIKGANWENMSNYVSFFEEKSTRLNAQDVMQHYTNGEFKKKPEHRVFNSKYTHSAYWFVLPIKSECSKDLDLVWSFYNNNFGIEFFDASDPSQPKYLGCVLPKDAIDKRLFPSRALCLPFSLQSGESKIILAKVFLQNSNQFYFLSDVTTVEDMMFWEQNYNLVVGKYLGYFIFMFLFNVFLFFLLKQKLHFWHALYILSIILFSISENIIDILILPSWLYEIFILFPRMFWLLISMYFAITVFQKFTEQATKFSTFYRLLKISQIFILIFIVIVFICSITLSYQNIIFYQVRIVMDIFLLIGSFLLFINILYSSFNGDRTSIYFLVATIFLFIAYINYILDSIWQLYIFYIQPGNILVGLAIEVTVLTALFIIKIVKQSRENQKNYILQSSENQLLTKRLLNIQEQERKSISQEIHDGVGSNISGIKVHLQNIFQSKEPIKELDKTEILNQIKDIYIDLRNISHQLMPAFIEDNNLSELLKNRIELYRKTYPNIEINAQQNIQSLAISQQIRLHLYRIITALLDNALKHSDCTEIDFQIYYEDSQLEITIQDNGKGFNPNNQFSGIGLKSVISRIAFLRGKYNIESNKNGSIFIIEIPIN